jgi:hypothetical protein
MLSAGFKPAVRVSEQLQTQALDHVATGVIEYMSIAVAYVIMLCIILPMLLIVGHIVSAGGFSVGYTGSHTK